MFSRKQKEDKKAIFELFKEGIYNTLSGETQSAKEFLDLYDNCFKLCLEDRSKKIYEFIHEATFEHCEKIKKDIETIYDFNLINVFSQSKLFDKDIHSVIRKQFTAIRRNYIQKKLLFYLVQVETISRITGYLERFYIPNSKKKPLSYLMIDTWNEIVGDK